MRSDKNSEYRKNWRISEMIDRWLCHPFIGTLFFLGIIFLIFHISFSGLGALLSRILARAFAFLLENAYIALCKVGASEALCRLLFLGIFRSVASVLACLPQTAILFSLFAALNHSGYTSRAIFALDHVFRPIGLSGKAILPLLMGFGCSVPAVLSASAIDEKETVVYALSFIPCNAKLSVLTLIMSVFYEDHRAGVALFIYLVCIAAALISICLSSKQAPLSPPPKKLTPMKMPSLSDLRKEICISLKDYLVRASTVVFLSSLVIVFFGSFTIRFTLAASPSESMLSHFGNLFAPLFAPLGFGDGRLVATLFSGMFAKETIVSSAEILIPEGLPSILTPAAALSFLVFSFTYAPCITTICTMKNTLGVKWTMGCIIRSAIISYVISYITYALFRIFI